jgi:hypothetical protein
MKNISLSCAIIALATSFSLGQQPQGSLTLSVEKSSHRTIYRLNSNDVTAEPLAALSKAIRSRGRDFPIVVLVDTRLSIDTLENARGLIDKAGFAKSEYYVFSVETGKMSKITVGRAMPIPQVAK